MALPRTDTVVGSLQGQSHDGAEKKVEIAQK